MAEGGRGGRRGRGRGGYGPAQVRDQYSTEREEGRSRALEELRGALAEVGRGAQQRRGKEGGEQQRGNWDVGRRHENGYERNGGGGREQGRGRGYQRQEQGRRDFYGDQSRGGRGFHNQMEGQGRRDFNCVEQEEGRSYQVDDGQNGGRGYHGQREGRGGRGYRDREEQGQDVRYQDQRQEVEGRQRFYQGAEEGGRRGGYRQRGQREKQTSKHERVEQDTKEEEGEVCSDLRLRLSSQLTKGIAECLVCLDRVRQTQPTWDCLACYQVFHLACIKKWAKNAMAPTGGWRCPGCQGVQDQYPQEYRCFCKKQRNPEWARNEGLVPHSCGELCGRERGPGCPHRCAELCHPGRCPPCAATVLAKCPCGRESKRQKCGEPLLCEAPCGRELGCGRHRCEATCHLGECQPCAATLQQVCHCGGSTREVPCTLGAEEVFTCSSPCPRLQECGQHPCPSSCHPGPCQPCSLTLSTVTHCPCGGSSLEKLYLEAAVQPRESCLDPVPTCGEKCQKPLPCGPPSSPHLCPLPCHPGLCLPCPLTTLVRCRCGHMDRELPCAELTTRADDARCGKQCKAKRSCGRHKCGEQCCIMVEHSCPLLCGQLLSCTLHRCEELCHRGKCPRCPMVSFQELACSCGAAIIYPPVACGVRPPECSRICARAHPCDHPVSHKCHSEEACPPCTTLTVKTCYGGHEQRKNLACHIEGISCGRNCGARMSCGQHWCIKTCHPGPCSASCSQPCRQPRACGHPCGAACHPGVGCPDTPCSTQVKLTCDCGNRSASVSCAEDSYSRVSTALLAARLQEEPINLAELGAKGKKLECSDECYKLLRNAGLADALQITNPELSSKVMPRYSDLLKDWVRRDSVLVASVHQKLVDLVKLSQESKHKSRSFSFPNMNRDKREFVHEYSQHFGMTTQSFDAEPMRNVIASAERGKCSVPTVSLLEAAGSARQRRPAQGSKEGGQEVSYTDLSRSREKSEPVVDWFG